MYLRKIIHQLTCEKITPQTMYSIDLRIEGVNSVVSSLCKNSSEVVALGPLAHRLSDACANRGGDVRKLYELRDAIKYAKRGKVILISETFEHCKNMKHTVRRLAVSCEKLVVIYADSSRKKDLPIGRRISRNRLLYEFCKKYQLTDEVFLDGLGVYWLERKLDD